MPMIFFMSFRNLLARDRSAAVRRYSKYPEGAVKGTNPEGVGLSEWSAGGLRTA
jgi:hypothetical protein